MIVILITQFSGATSDFSCKNRPLRVPQKRVDAWQKELFPTKWRLQMNEEQFSRVSEFQTSTMQIADMHGDGKSTRRREWDYSLLTKEKFIWW